MAVDTESGLPTTDDDIEPDGCDGGCESDDGEGEEGLEGTADVDSCRIAPVGCVAGGEDCVGDAPAEQAEGDTPED